MNKQNFLSSPSSNGTPCPQLSGDLTGSVSLQEQMRAFYAMAQASANQHDIYDYGHCRSNIGVDPISSQATSHPVVLPMQFEKDRRGFIVPKLRNTRKKMNMLRAYSLILGAFGIVEATFILFTPEPAQEIALFSCIPCLIASFVCFYLSYKNK